VQNIDRLMQNFMMQMIGEDDWIQIQVAGPTFKTQMIVAGFFAVLWGSFFQIVHSLVFRKVMEQPWSNTIYLVDKKAWKALNLPEDCVTKEYTIRTWISFFCASLQHGVSMMFCFPRIFHLFNNSEVENAYVRFGGLCETGWEQYDLLICSAQFMMAKDKNGKTLALTNLIFVCMHHIMGQLVIPTANMLITSDEEYWVYAFSLAAIQGSVFLTFPLMNYSKTLDITKRSQFDQFYLITIIMATCNVLVRGIIWTYCCYKSISITWKYGWMVFGVVCISLVPFSLFNFVLISDWVSKAIKYRNKFPKTSEDNEEEMVLTPAEFEEILMDQSMSSDTPGRALARFLLTPADYDVKKFVTKNRSFQTLPDMDLDMKNFAQTEPLPTPAKKA